MPRLCARSCREAYPRAQVVYRPAQGSPNPPPHAPRPPLRPSTHTLFALQHVRVAKGVARPLGALAALDLTVLWQGHARRLEVLLLNEPAGRGGGGWA